MLRRIRKKTLFFIGFMIFFFMLLLYLTYYSHVAYFEGLPLVSTVMPERTGEYANGRYLYVIPAEAVQEDKDNNKLYIYTARSYRDILGERSLVTTIVIYVKEELDKDRVVVDGIVREEPVITENFDVLYEGQAVLEKGME